MKKFVTILLLLLFFLPVVAGTKHRVTLVKQYVAGEDQLPSKTLEAKVPVVKLLPGNKNPFPAMLQTFLSETVSEDWHNPVYVLDMRYGGAGIMIYLASCDILEPGVTYKFYGDLMLNRKHLLLVEDEENKALLKQFFARERGSDVIFTRVYESVLDLDEEAATQVKVVYNERTREITRKVLVVAGEDLMNTKPAKPAAPAQIDTEDDDPFQIDVELNDE